MPRLADGTAYEQHGSPKGPAVVLIHGLGLRRALWKWLIPELEARYNVISYDLYGHGDSALPLQEPSLRVFSDQLSKVLDACSVHAASVVGFSLGGMIARRFAQDHPERVQSLAILHSPHQRTAEAQKAILARVDQARVSGSSVTVEAALERWFTDGYRADHPEMMDLVRAWVLSNDIAIYHRNYRVLAEGVDEVTGPTPPIRKPALVITGDQDFGNGPEMTRAIADEIEGATVLILKGLRHMALMEDPKSTSEPLLAVFDQHILGTGK